LRNKIWKIIYPSLKFLFLTVLNNIKEEIAYECTEDDPHQEKLGFEAINLNRELIDVIEDSSYLNETIFNDYTLYICEC